MGFLLAAASFGAGICASFVITRRKVRSLKASATRALELRQEERRGRIRAERSLAENRTRQDAARNVSICYDSLGVVRTPFVERNGTPWQGLPHTVAVLELDSRWSPALSLQGLEEFSHLIILFCFDRNVQGRKQKYRAKVSPPRAHDVSVGCLATRSPHRPAPLGLTIVRILRVDHTRGHVWIGELDILDGTCIVDIKPYIPQYDSKPDASVASWVRPHHYDFEEVLFTQEVQHFIASRCTRLYPSGEHARLALETMLRYDIRREAQKAGSRCEHSILFDGVRYTFQVDNNRVLVVHAKKERPS